MMNVRNEFSLVKFKAWSSTLRMLELLSLVFKTWVCLKYFRNTLNSLGVNPHIIYSYTSSSSTSTDPIKCGLCSIVTFYHWEISINNWTHQLPRWYSGKESTWQCRRWFDPWGGKIPWRRKWQPTPVFLPEKVHGERRLAGYRPCMGWQRVEKDWAHIPITY